MRMSVGRNHTALLRGLVVAAALLVGLSRPAAAGPITGTYPDLTVSPFDIFWDGTNFSATGNASTQLSLDVDGVSPQVGPSDGDIAISWNALSGTGTLLVTDLEGLILGSAQDLLRGTIVAFGVLIDAGTHVDGLYDATFGLIAYVGPFQAPAGISALNQGDYVLMFINSSDFDLDNILGHGPVGTAKIDIEKAVGVPEPATLALVALGTGALAVRRRRRQRI